MWQEVPLSVSHSRVQLKMWPYLELLLLLLVVDACESELDVLKLRHRQSRDWSDSTHLIQPTSVIQFRQKTERVEEILEHSGEVAGIYQ